MAVYRLTRTAVADILNLLAATEANFGEIARLRYERLIDAALRDISAEPDRRGSVARPVLGQGVRSYHLRHSRERARAEYGIVLRPRHLLLYRHPHTDLIGIGESCMTRWTSTGISQQNSGTSDLA